jgi:branched-chain amino acid transport system permease protein
MNSVLQQAGISRAYGLAPSSQRSKATAVLVCFIVLIGFFAPQLTESSFYMGVGIQGIIVAIGALAVAFLLHQCGLCMFGIAGITGSATYMVAIGTMHFGLNLYAAVACALLGGVLFSTVVGILIVRTGHLPFAMITLALGQMLRQIVQITSLRPLLGGDDGITMTFAGGFLGLSPEQLANPMTFWPIAWGALCITTFVLWYAANAKLGHLLRAIQDNDERMRFSGYNTLMPRLSAFVLASFVASVAGILTALHLAYASPELLDFSTGGHMLTAALVGGISTTLGPVIGGVLFGLAHDQFSALGYLELLTGVVIVLAVAVFPEGHRSLRVLFGLGHSAPGGK